MQFASLFAFVFPVPPPPPPNICCNFSKHINSSASTSGLVNVAAATVVVVVVVVVKIQRNCRHMSQKSRILSLFKSKMITVEIPNFLIFVPDNSKTKFRHIDKYY